MPCLQGSALVDITGKKTAFKAPIEANQSYFSMNIQTSNFNVLRCRSCSVSVCVYRHTFSKEAPLKPVIME